MVFIPVLSRIVTAHYLLPITMNAAGIKILFPVFPKEYIQHPFIFLIIKQHKNQHPTTFNHSST
jgi:hypothetical protein